MKPCRNSVLHLPKDEIKNSAFKLHIFSHKSYLNKDQLKKYSSFEVKYNKLGESHNQLDTVCNPDVTTSYKLIFHGFGEEWDRNSFRYDWINKLLRELFTSKEEERLCVIVLDWFELSNGGKIPFGNYFKAMNDNTYIASDLLTEFFRNNRINEKKMHCIGFSLGGQLCGIFYKMWMMKFYVKPHRITGLDPTGIMYGEKQLSQKLNSNDANLVDIIHTSSDFGSSAMLGHMNFLQDGGRDLTNACASFNDRTTNMENILIYEENNFNYRTYDNVFIENPKVDLTSLTSIKAYARTSWKNVMSFFYKNPQRIFIKAHNFFTCGHFMTLHYFIYSINVCAFEVSICENLKTKRHGCLNTKSQPRMGYYADLSHVTYNGHWAFYVHTNSKAPFCTDRRDII